MALASRPRLRIADEPTTALDVTMQAQILALIKDLQGEFGMAVLMITHDLGVIAESCHRVSVMYWGRIVESTTVEKLFANPRHPYTQGLLKSIPVIGRTEHLVPIEGSVPDPFELPSGCTFAPRCPHATDQCREAPELREVATGHQISCWLDIEE